MSTVGHIPPFLHLFLSSFPQAQEIMEGGDMHQHKRIQRLVLFEMGRQMSMQMLQPHASIRSCACREGRSTNCDMVQGQIQSRPRRLIFSMKNT